MIRWLTGVAAFSLTTTALMAQTPMGTAFTYQGRLTDNGVAPTGVYDLRLTLHTALTGGSQVGATITLEDVAVTAGVFTVRLDFGAAAFTGDARWLQIAVRPGTSTGSFTTLTPRQELTPTPHALVAAAFQGRYQGVRVVAKSGGDYTNPLTAVNDAASWCPSPTSESRCLLKVMPGTYDIGANSLQMTPYLDIEGSGMESTVIRGCVESATTGLVRAATMTKLRQIQVANGLSCPGPGTANAVAIHSDGTSLELTHVAAKATNTGRAMAVLLINSVIRMHDVRAHAIGTSVSYGIYSGESQVDMDEVDILAEGAGVTTGIFLETGHLGRQAEIRGLRVWVNSNSAGTHNYGIFVRNIPVSVHGARIMVDQAGIYSYGVFQVDSPDWGLELRDVVVRVVAGNGFGVFNAGSGGTVTVEHSDIWAPTNSIRNDNAAKAFRVGASKLGGMPWGTVKCVLSYNDAYNPLNSTCLP